MASGIKAFIPSAPLSLQIGDTQPLRVMVSDLTEKAKMLEIILKYWFAGVLCTMKHTVL